MTGDRLGTVLLTGVGRRRSIGSAIATGLARDGWDLVLNHWTPYDARLGYERTDDAPSVVAEQCRRLGSRVELVESDLADPDTPARLVAHAAAVGDLRALVMSHCESVDSSILTIAEQLPTDSADVTGRIVALTSDHTAHNLPYGASKGALDRIVIAAAVEMGQRGVRANVVNPGPVDTGWMTDEIRAMGVAQTPAGRLGTGSDTANLVRFLLSDQGSWINGQLIYSNGGFRTS
jgi:3-oxoacyl-[acyl-carrier protein] reductase